MKGTVRCLVVLVVVFLAGSASAVDATCEPTLEQGNPCILPDGSSTTLEAYSDAVYVAIPSGEFTLECTLTPTLAEGQEAHFLFGTVALEPHDTYESSPKIKLANRLNTLAEKTVYRIDAVSYVEGSNAAYRSFWFQNYGYEPKPSDAYPITIACTLQ